MATYTSTQTGNWSDNATWGGAGHPLAGDDIVNIGHTVTYDMGDVTTAWSLVTVTSGGILTFPTGANSRMRFNASTGKISVSSGGELRIGTSSTPIGSGYTCTIEAPQGSSTRDIITGATTSVIGIYGDSAYYGDSYRTKLNADWTTGQTFTIIGDYTSKWQAGQLVVVDANRTSTLGSNDWKTYCPVFTISSIAANGSNTDITITESNPGFTCYSQGYVFNISRNVVVQDYESPKTLGSTYTNRLNITLGSGNNNLDNFASYGLYNGLIGSGTVSSNRIVCAFGQRGVDIIGAHTDCVTYYQKTAGVRSPGTGNFDIIGCNSGIIPYAGCDVKASRILWSYSAVNQSESVYPTSRIDAEIVNAYYAINGTYTNSCVSGVMKTVKYVTGAYSPHICNAEIDNIAVYLSYSGTDALVENCAITNMASLATNTYHRNCVTLINTSVDGSLIRYKLSTYAGEVLSIDSSHGDWEVPPSSNSFIYRMTPNSLCLGGFVGQWLNLFRGGASRNMVMYATAGSRTLTMKVYPVGWSGLTNLEVELELFYVATSGGPMVRTINGTQTLTADTWNSITISFTQASDYQVWYNLMLKKYESGKILLVDPIAVLT